MVIVLFKALHCVDLKLSPELSELWAFPARVHWFVIIRAIVISEFREHDAGTEEPVVGTIAEGDSSLNRRSAGHQGVGQTTDTEERHSVGNLETYPWDLTLYKVPCGPIS